MEPSGKQKIKLLIFYLVVPILPIYVAYLIFMFSIIHSHIDYPLGSETDFYRGFIDTSIGKDYPPINVAIVGDSTARQDVDPNYLEPVFVVNLGLLSGTNLTSYHTMVKYLAHHPPPRCVLAMGQAQWAFNYRAFSERMVSTGIFGIKDLMRVWKMGHDNNIYPATRYSAIHYLVHELPSFLNLRNVPLRQIAAWVDAFTNPFKAPPKIIFDPTRIEHRGFSSRNRVLNEREFYPTDVKKYQAFWGPFHSSPTEDFYLRRMAEMARSKKFKLIIARSPVADSQWVAPTENFRRESINHLRAVLKDFPEVIYADLPETLPRPLFFNFTHMNASGSQFISGLLKPLFEKECVAR